VAPGESGELAEAFLSRAATGLDLRRGAQSRTTRGLPTGHRPLDGQPSGPDVFIWWSPGLPSS
jgi:hypothetical protein